MGGLAEAMGARNRYTMRVPMAVIATARRVARVAIRQVSLIFWVLVMVFLLFCCLVPWFYDLSENPILMTGRTFVFKRMKAGNAGFDRTGESGILCMLAINSF